MRPKSKKDTGLGKAIIRDRFKGNTRPKDGDTFLHTTELNDGASWTNLQSITQQRDLDEFLSTAQLAGTQFTAERLNIKLVTNTYHNPFLLSAEKEKEVLARQEANKDRLVIPRRPKWDKTTTPSQLERNERDSFLQWRRDLAFLQEKDEFLLTPFERNLEVWRQLWRVIERSDLVVQIVDARNPLFFRSTDLEKYVKEVDKKKKNLLLINKADLLNANQRRLWADCLDSQGIRYIFFSAVLAQEKLNKEQLEVASDDNINAPESQDDNDGEKECVSKVTPVDKDKDEDAKDYASEYSDNSNIYSMNPEHNVDDSEKVRIRTITDLISLLVVEASDFEDSAVPDKKLTIGLVGYPNVGKSSTINALLGEKRVSVSSTPGKTKHFQTIHLSPSLVLCDCPGLVFPNFATTNADMICNGVLPIDQLREHTGPVALVAQRVPISVLEAMYGIKIRTRTPEEGGNGIPTAEELLIAYAVARGFTKSGHGSPDESRAARYILKDYVNGKLPFCHPPPIGISPEEFNAELHDVKLYTKTKKKMTLLPPSASPSTVTQNEVDISKSFTEQINISTKSQALDKSFFSNQTPLPKIKGKYAGEFSRVKLYSIHGTLGNDGKPIDGYGSISPSAGVIVPSGKKHHKKGKKNLKNRGANGYDI